jgi:hypothetical protein
MIFFSFWDGNSLYISLFAFLFCVVFSKHYHYFVTDLVLWWCVQTVYIIVIVTEMIIHFYYSTYTSIWTSLVKNVYLDPISNPTLFIGEHFVYIEFSVKNFSTKTCYGLISMIKLHKFNFESTLTTLSLQSKSFPKRKWKHCKTNQTSMLIVSWLNNIHHYRIQQ